MAPSPRMGLRCSQPGSGRRGVNFRGDACVYLRVYAHARPHAGDAVFLKCAERCAENTNPQREQEDSTQWHPLQNYII